MRTLSCPPSTEIIGQTVLSYVDNIQSDDMQPYLEKYHLDNINPAQWYPAAQFFDLLNDIGQHEGAMSNMVAVGMAVVDKMIVPPELEHVPLSQILLMWNDLYQLQHRNADIGYVQTEKVTETHYRTLHQHLYPDDFTYGIGYGMAKRWLPRGTPFKVYFDPKIPHMDDGGDMTIIHVQWE